MRAFGSPSSLPGATITQFDPGFGAPSVDTYDSLGLTTTLNSTGFGHPAIGQMAQGSPNPPSFVWNNVKIMSTADVAAALRDNNWQGMLDNEYGDMGGNLVWLYAPLPGFPIRGPYEVRLVDADGNYWPDANETGCYSALAGFGDDCEANRSREFLAFTLPKVPQGLYGVRLTWGLNSIELAEQILIIAQDDPAEAQWLIKGFPVKD